MLRICFANSKGGVGKSTAAILALEWFAHRGFRVQLRDLDENRTTESWAERCTAAGREIFSEEPDLEVIETAGLLGAADAFLEQADLIVVPFKPLTADLQRTIVGNSDAVMASITAYLSVPNYILCTRVYQALLRKLSIALMHFPWLLCSGLAELLCSLQG